MIYVRALEKVLNEKDIKRSQYAQAKRVCEATLQEIRVALQNQQVSTEGNDRSTPINGDVYNSTNDHSEEANGENRHFEISSLLQNEDGSLNIDTEKYYVPFESATQGDSPRVTIAALDGLQKLLAHGQLTGNYSNPTNPNKKLIDRIVETICSCYNGAETDEGVELQIIKALLTVVTSQYVQIHEGTILLTLRTCYNIYLTTKSTVNQTTARAMLTQMLHSIFTRMEIALEGRMEVPKVELGENNNNFNATTEQLLEHVTVPLKDWEQESVFWYSNLNLDFSLSFLGSESDNLKGITEIETSEVLETQSLAKETVNASQDDDAQRTEGECRNVGVISGSLAEDANVTGDGNPDLNPEERGDNSLGINKVSSEQQSTDPAEQNPPLKELLKPQDIENELKNKEKETVPSSFIHILQKDAFLTFWALCKLAVKQSPTEDVNNEVIKAIEAKSKILSFQLLRSILENCGDVFKTSTIFITAIKQYLCSAMMQAGTSSISEVFQINLDLFGNLMKYFRTTLKTEIEQLFEQVLLPVLSPSSSASPEYKLLALGVINKLFGDLKCLTEIYINYDAPGSSESKIFERMVQCVCKTLEINGTDSSSRLTSGSLRILGTESLITLLKTIANCLPKNETPPAYRQDQSTVDIDTKDESDEKLSEDFKISFEGCDFVSGFILLVGNIPTSADVPEIDMLVQKLAQAVCESNDTSEKFESGDCVYALVYSTISLIGELSNNLQGKCRISKEQFVKMNRGINGCKALSDNYVEKVYDEIEAYLLGKQVVVNSHHHQRKRQLSEKSENVVNNAKRLISVIGLQKSSISSEKQVRYIRRMFKTVGKCVLSVLMGTLTECDDTTISDLCLSGIQYAIHIASLLNLKNERDSYVQALSRLSLAALKLIKSKNINAMVITSKTSSMTTTENGVTKTTVTTTTETKCRNVDIIQTLLNVAISEGNYLGNAWLETLKCISQLEAAQLLGDISSRTSSRSNSPSPNALQPNSKSWYAWAGSLVPSFWDSSGNKLDMASVKESMGVLVHKIFADSTKLDENGIVDFFKALCQVSLIEITHPESPRSFVYEKIFEVAHLNMDRTCLQWSSIWQVLADYFSHLACSSDEEVSFFAIDSVTKLAVYLIEKEGLGNFRFQTHILQPFETILRNTPFNTTREYVLDSITKIVKSNTSELRSGWILILKILEYNVYTDNNPNNSAMSFAMIQGILGMFENVEVNLMDSFEEIIRCLKDFAFKAPSPSIQSDSVEMLKKMAQLVHDKPELLVDLNEKKVDNIWSKGWSPLFTQLSNVVIYAEIEGFDDFMQANALSIFFDLVKTYGDSLKKSWWKSLFDILFRIFDKLKFFEENIVAEERVLADSTKGNYSHYYCYYYVQFAIVDTFIRHYEVIGSVVLVDLLEELQWCISQRHEQIALSGVQCLHQIIRMLDGKFSQSEWSAICKLVQDLIKTSFAQEPVPVADDVAKDTTKSVCHCVSNSIVQLELLKLVKSVLFSQTNREDTTEVKPNDNIPGSTRHSSSILRNMFTAKEFLSFSDKVEGAYNYAISQSSKEMQEPSSLFIPHEILSLEILFILLFQMYQNNSSWFEIELEEIETKLERIISNALQNFITVPSQSHRDSLTEITAFCLDSITNLPHNKFKMFTSIYYSLLCDMLEVQLNTTLSLALCKYFLKIGRSIDIFKGVHPEFLKANEIESNSVNREDLTTSINDSSKGICDEDESGEWNKVPNFQISFSVPESVQSSV